MNTAMAAVSFAALGFGMALVLVPLCNRLARHWGAMAMVRADRWHTQGSVPRLTGPALLIALLPWLDGSGVLVLTGFCLIGCVDDVRPLPAAIKALLMLVPAGAAAALTGQMWLAPALWCAANAFNLLDHADGITGASAAVTLAATGSAAGLAGSGACLGFLVINFPPARCFLGDGGSLLLGAAAVWLWAPTGPMAAVAWCLVPLTDAAVVTLRRLMVGQRPWIGGTDHSAHVLLRLGASPRVLPILYAATSAAMGIVGERLLSG